MTFDEFQKFINQLYKLAQEETPNYAIVKDLFDYMDKTKNYQIEMNEWLDTFTKNHHHSNNKRQSEHLLINGDSIRGSRPSPKHQRALSFNNYNNRSESVSKRASITVLTSQNFDEFYKTMDFQKNRVEMVD